MLDNIYNTKTSDNFQTFEFTSEGPKGFIHKVIEYTKTEIEGIYNLGFGDKNKETGYVDDLSITDNKDSKKVLATVAVTLYLFTDEYPDTTILATGSTTARTRLYQMGIANNFEVIQKDFTVLGYDGNTWEPFKRNITYSAFLVRRKA